MKNLKIDSLYSFTTRSNYSEALIEQLAQSIDSTGGLLRPLIVYQTSPDDEGSEFEVLDGHIFYWAAVHADNTSISHVPCWVIDDLADMSDLLQQLEYIASIGTSTDIDDVQFLKLVGAE